jgi:hypothetical protein
MPTSDPNAFMARRHAWRLPALLMAALAAASCAVAPALVGAGFAPVTVTAARAGGHGCRRAPGNRGEGRPKASYSLKSERFPLTVHWQNDDRRARATALLHHVEGAWQREVVELGWAAPLADAGKGGDDSLDLYLVPVGAGQAYVAEERRQTKPFAVASSYVVFDDGLKDDGTLESYAFHEFNHVCQYAIDANEGDAFYENSAAFMDRFLKPDGPASQTGIADFQAQPERSVDYIGTEGEYEYGAGTFLQFLVERYGKGRPDLVRRLWEAGRQPAVGGSDPNEPDWQDVLPGVLRDLQGPDAETALTAFQAWRLQSALTRPARLPKPALIVDGGHPDQVQPQASRRPAPWGANFLKLDTKGAKTLTAKLTDGGRDRWRLWLGTLAADGSWSMVQSPTASQQATASLSLGSATTVYAIVVNLGDGKHDPDRKDWAGQSYRLGLDWHR